MDPAPTLYHARENLVRDALHNLHFGEQKRAEASKLLCDLGVLFKGVNPQGVEYVVPAPHIQALIPNWRTDSISTEGWR